MSRSKAVIVVVCCISRGILVYRRNGHGEREEGRIERGGDLPSLIHKRAPNLKDTSIPVTSFFRPSSFLASRNTCKTKLTRGTCAWLVWSALVRVTVHAKPRKRGPSCIERYHPFQGRPSTRRIHATYSRYIICPPNSYLAHPQLTHSLTYTVQAHEHTHSEFLDGISSLWGGRCSIQVQLPPFTGFSSTASTHTHTRQGGAARFS